MQGCNKIVQGKFSVLWYHDSVEIMPIDKTSHVATIKIISVAIAAAANDDASLLVV